MPQDNLQNSDKRGPQGKYNPLYPGELGRALFHPEMDYNLDLIGQVIHGFRVMGSNNDGTINANDDVEKVLKLYIVTSDDDALIEAGALVGDRVWVPVTVSTGGGPQGYQGYQGRQGSQGRQGPRGFQGTQGIQGNQGFQGPVAIGLPGDTGGDGPQGFQGPQGVQGFQGVQGRQGSIGNYGGDSLRFLVGTYNGTTASSGAITFSNMTTLPSPTINIIVSHTDADGGSAAAWFTSMFAAKGSLRITRPGRTTEYLDYAITSGSDLGARSIINLAYVGGTVSAIGTSWPVGTELIVSYAKTGPQGAQGHQGVQGTQGANEGPQGVQGSPGEPGGPQGDQGPVGLGYGGLVATTQELTVGTGTKTFDNLNLSDVETSFQLGTRIRATSEDDTNVWMEGVITSYVGTAMVINSDTFNGTGDYTGWTISVAGQPGIGSQGNQGPQGARGAQGYQGPRGFRGLDGANSLRWKWQANGSFPTPDGFFNGNWANGGAFNINSLTSIYLDYEDSTLNTVTPWLTLLKAKVDSGAEVILQVGDSTNPNYYGTYTITAAQFSSPAAHLELTIDLITGTTAPLIGDREYVISWSANGSGGSGNQGYQGPQGEQGDQGPQPSSIQVTRGELEVLINTNSLVVNALYKITDAHSSLFGGTNIFLKAIETNKLEEYGTGIFYTPKYSNPTGGNGVWANYLESTITNISGLFDNQETVIGRNISGDVADGILVGNVVSGFIISTGGDWESATTIYGTSNEATADISDIVLPIGDAVDDTTIWGGYVWKNLTGDIGINDDILNLDSTNWVKIEYDDPDWETYYNITYDTIKYDYENDWISYREDNAGNKVEFDHLTHVNFEDNSGITLSSIATFQWGNAMTYNVAANEISNGYCENLNFRGSQYHKNIMRQGSQYFGNIMGQGSNYYLNTIGQNSVYNSNTQGQGSNCYNNTIGIGSNFSSNVQGQGSLYQNNTIGQGSLYLNNTIGQGSSYTNNTQEQGSSYQNNVMSQGSEYLNNTIGQSGQCANNTQPASSIIQFTTIENGTNINGVDFTGATVIFESQPKTIYKRPDDTVKIRYYNNSDVLVIASIID